ncbi:hypothetical protein CEP54_009750 [Fusarium duplospermum]|uniref:NACHT domain-containing protein n=1 Tax=Fusarium duplospermum TaxID=1325734 RepID=A0A428PNM2_9HYPO|nr:hypothetical protein CEP54_009750 [Fusarium duplospermum]
MEEIDPFSSDPWEKDEHRVHKELVEWLIPVDYDSQQAEFARRRHPGTLQWFLDSDIYQKWIHANFDLNPEGQTQDFRTLFCLGPAGAGKTILASVVIEDLDRRFPKGSDSNVGIAYLYCVYNRQEQQSITNLLLALLEQLLPNRPRRRFPTRLPHHTQDRFAPTMSLPSLDQIMESLEEVVSKYDRVFFVVDALDECAAEDRNGLLKEIFRLQTFSEVHLFATADSDSDVEHMFASKPSLSIHAKQGDVRSYLDRSMGELPAFVKENPDLKEEIKDTIIKAAPGSFLAAALQLKSLAAMSSAQDVQTGLTAVQRDSASAHYDALYEAAMLRIESQAADQVVLAKRTLAYMLCARCPWTFAELCHALMVNAGEPELNWDTMPSFQATIDACSGMLVTVGSEERGEHENLDNKETAMVPLDRMETQLVHRTAHEYLQQTYERWLPEAEKQIAAACMAYLSLRSFSSGPDLESRLRAFPLYFYSALHWGFHARKAFDKCLDTAMTEYDFLGSSSLIQTSCDVMFKVGRWPMDGDYVGGYPEGLTGLHIAAYFGIVNLVRTLGSREAAMVNEQDGWGFTALSWAAKQGHEETVETILKFTGIDVDIRDSRGRTPLSLAARQNHTAIVKLLLNHDADPNFQDFQQATPLWHAAKGGHTATVALLTKYGVDVNVTLTTNHNQGHTPLSLAAMSGQVEVISLLLAQQSIQPRAKIENSNDGKYKPYTPLGLAVHGGHPSAVEVLLSNPNIAAAARAGEDGEMLLHMAVWHGHEEIVGLLLSNGMDVNARSDTGNTPLHHAVDGLYGSYDGIARLLLSQANLIPDLANIDGDTPASLAVSLGRFGVLRMLLAKGVDMEAKIKDGLTLLSLAASRGYLPITELLLAMDGVDADSRNGAGRTPLTLAANPPWGPSDPYSRSECVRDHCGVVKCLLNSGRIDINSRDDSGETPLMHAARSGDHDLSSFRMILGYEGVDIDAMDNKGRTALFMTVFEDGDGDSDNSHWSGTNDGEYPTTFRAVGSSIETQIELRTQNQVISGDECKEEELCPQCKALNLDRAFSRGPPDGFRVIADLGKVDKSWESRPCAMCKLIAVVCPPGVGKEGDLCAYSSTTMCLSRHRDAAENYFMSDWVDTVILGVEEKVYHAFGFGRDRAVRSLRRNAPVSSDDMPYDFISRIGSNDRHRLRSLTVHRLQAKQVDFGRARGWIACCEAHHGRRCNPSTRRPITSFRLIDCTTRDIIDGQLAMDEFVALSYVWGPSARKPTTVDHVRVERAERVVEDAIQVTLGLGYRYLWVDRHCITNEDEKIRKRQLLEMNAVYANAQVTIVAAAGEDSAFGLPGVSRARQQPYARVQDHALVAVPLDPAEYIQKSVWWTRGWTFQEGVLSRRRLIFTEHEVSYECRGMVTRECIELPERIHRIAATRYPIHEDARVFSRRGLGGRSIWSLISEYTQRHLTHDHDILNAMLGILKVVAERKLPVYHLCGVPVVLANPNKTDGRTLLEAFVTGLCWKVDTSTRREGFPSWSWTGWKGRAHGAKQAAISFKFGFAIDVFMVPRDDPSETLSWVEFEAMGPKEKAALPQDYMLEITGIAFELSIRSKHVFPPYAVLYHGDAALKGSVELCRHPKQDASFQQRLAEDRLAAIAIGNEETFSSALVLLVVAKVGPITELGYTQGCIHTWDGQYYTDVTGTFDGVESPYLSKVKMTAEPGTTYWTKTTLTVEEENIDVATKVPAVALVYQSSDLEKATLTGGREKATSSSGESDKNAAAAPLSVRGMIPVVAVVVSMLAGAGLLAPW